MFYKLNEIVEFPPADKMHMGTLRGTFTDRITERLLKEHLNCTIQ